MVQSEKLQLQRPDISVELVTPAADYAVDIARYPWIHEGRPIPTVYVRMEDGTEFRYGSIIGLSHSVEKIASEVPKDSSRKAEESMFMALPFLIKGQTYPAVDKVMDAYGSSELLKVGKKGPDAARLVFAIEQAEDDLPVILRVGIASHKKQAELLGLITTKQRLRKQDGTRR